MKQINHFFMVILLLLSSCNFEEGDKDSGSSLITEHRKVENEINIQAPASGIYGENDFLTVQVSHPYPMLVTGTPSIGINIDGNIVYADYYTGSGQKTLEFRYQVTTGLSSEHGITVVGPGIILNGGSLEFDNKGTITSVNTSFDNVNLSSIIIDATAPTITSITPPDSRTYFENHNLNFSVNFDEKVYVGGTPVLNLDIGGVNTQASYVSGSGSNSLVFRKTVSSLEVDNNGIDLLGNVDLNGGEIADSAGNNALTNFPAQNFNGVLVQGTTPYVIQAIVPEDGIYVPGDQLIITLEFNKAVTVSGLPQIPIDIGGETLNAVYLSGSGSEELIFQASLVSGYEDEDGIEIDQFIDLNGGLIRSAAINAHLQTYAPLTPGIIINAPLPKVLSIELPTVPAHGYFNQGDEMYFTLRFNNTVEVTAIPEIQMLLDSTSPTLSIIPYNSGSGGKNLVMRYVVQAGDEDHTGIDLDSLIRLNGGTIQNTNGTNADLDLQTAIDLLDLSTIKVDAIPPEVVGATVSPNNTYAIGENIDITLEFREVVTVTGTPRLTLTVGSSTRYATYQSGAGSQFLNFRYSVTNGYEDTDGIEFANTNINLNGGEIQDLGGNDTLLDFSAHAPNLSLINVDGIRPQVTNITIAPGLYTLGQTLTATVEFNEEITVSGTPTIPLQLTEESSSGLALSYQSGSGSDTLIFSYTVQADDEDHDGIGFGPNIIDYTNIVDLNGNTAVATLGTTHFPSVLIDALAPDLTLTSPLNNSYINESTDSSSFTVAGSCNDDSASYSILIDGSPAPGQTITCSASSLAGSFNSIALAEGSFSVSIEAQDPSGNSSTSNSRTVIKDITAPELLVVDNPADDNYIVDMVLNFIATFDEEVTISSGHILIQTNFGNLQALNVTAPAGDTHNFRYTVTANDYDNDGISIQGNILNANITDAAGNSAIITFTPNDTSNIFINNGTPAFNWKHIGSGPSPISYFDYGPQSVNVGQIFTITNSGDAPTTNITVQLTDTGAGAFNLVSHNCPVLLGIDGTCEATIEFLMGFPQGNVLGAAEVTDTGHVSTPSETLSLEGERQ